MSNYSGVPLVFPASQGEEETNMEQISVGGKKKELKGRSLEKSQSEAFASSDVVMGDRVSNPLPVLSS